MESFEPADWPGGDGTESAQWSIGLHEWTQRPDNGTAEGGAGVRGICNSLAYFMAATISSEVLVQRSKQILLALGLGAVVAGGGIGFAATTSSSSKAAPATVSSVGPARTGSATVNVTTASVGGKSEQVLVDAAGLPLYTYGADSASQSHVSGGLARLWPPLVSGSPTEAGATGKLSVLADANGQQVQYNGHFLYTFVDDTAGQVTGQGVQDFFVATPGLGTSAATAAPAPAATQNNSYGY